MISLARRAASSGASTAATLAVVAGLIAPLAPAAAEPWQAAIEAGGEFDSNVRRVEVAPGDPQPDAAPLVRVDAELRKRGTRGAHLRWTARAAGGARAAVASPVNSENRLTAALDLAAERDGPGDDLAVLVRASHYDVFPVDGAAGTRAFASSGVDLGLRLGGGGRTATVTAGLRRLDYKPDPDFDWTGQAVAVRLAELVWHGADDQTLELGATYRLERRGYRGRAFADGCLPDEPPSPSCFVPTTEARSDLHHVAQAELTYTGPRVASLTYQATINDSSSFGSSLHRHRVIGAVTTPLPGRLFATASVTVQFDRYLDALLVASDVVNQTFTSIDDENRNGVAVRLARDLSDAWQAEARWSFQANAFADGGRVYRRHLVYAGLAWQRR